MLRRMFLKSGAAGAAALPLVRAAKPRIQRPNFLFLIADDLTYRGIHTLGNDEIHTPNLDRLVKRGCSFTHCFHQGSWSGAVCVPSRTMLNTGLTAFRAQRRAEETPLWGETLGGAGYNTSIIGKWHLSEASLRRSFKEKGPVSPGMFESGPSAYHRPVRVTPGRPGISHFRGNGCTPRSGRWRQRMRSSTRPRCGRNARPIT
jgi:arylsulfatase A-like enzyme